MLTRAEDARSGQEPMGALTVAVLRRLGVIRERIRVVKANAISQKGFTLRRIREWPDFFR